MSFGQAVFRADEAVFIPDPSVGKVVLKYRRRGVPIHVHTVAPGGIVNYLRFMKFKRIAVRTRSKRERKVLWGMVPKKDQRALSR